MSLYLDPVLIAIFASMFGGKTEEAIKLARHYEIAGFPIQAFKYSEDDRYGNEDVIAGHAGGRLPASPIRNSYQIENLRDPNAKVIIIDELQFLDDLVIDLVDSWANEVIMICTFLDTCFTGEPFPLVDHTDPKLKRISGRHVGEVIARADLPIHLTGICTYQKEDGPCNAPATRTQRMIDGKPAPYDSPLKIIGGAEEGYEARCRLHHFVPGKPEPNLKPKF
jgi:thymidine kinase